MINSNCQNSQVTGTYIVENNKIVQTYTDTAGQLKQKVLTVIALTYEEINLSYTDSETNTIVFLKLRK